VVRTDPMSYDPELDPGHAEPVSPAARPGPRITRPFLVQVAALRKVAGTTRDVVRRGSIDDLGAVSVSVPPGSVVEADLVLSSYPGGITETGTETAPWHGECRRCGGPVAGRVAAEVRERYAPVGGNSEDEDAYPLDGDEVDLEPLVRDAVLLELPLAPLCTADCLGLCPQCGTNWNQDSCSCAPATDPRWAALDGLRDA
jgi:uncharacterized protein